MINGCGIPIISEGPPGPPGGLPGGPNVAWSGNLNQAIAHIKTYRATAPNNTLVIPQIRLDIASLLDFCKAYFTPSENIEVASFS